MTLRTGSLILSAAVIEGAQIGGYRVLHQIGEGGMGAVWMAEHAMLGRRAAIKILHPSFSSRQDIVARFFNEARAATAISDPGIIQIFDFGFDTDGSAYIVMELLEGEPLDRRLQRQGALPVGDALRICRQVAGSVGAAHARGIIHRDLKPENIFMVRDPEVVGGERAKVLDFGIAKLAGDLGSVQKTSTSAIIGTPLYMSPEQCRGAGQVDQRSDVYSLGCVLFALVTGHAPFGAEGTGELIMQHMMEPPPRPSTRSLGVPAEVDELILRCLAKQPAERFGSGAELARAIEAVMAYPAVMHAARLAPTVVPHAKAATTLGSSAAYVAASASAVSSPGRGKLYAALAAVLVIGGGATAIVLGTRDSETTTAAAPAPTPDPGSAIAPPPPPPVVDPKPGQAKADIQATLAAFTAWSAAHAGAPCPTSTELGGRTDPWGRGYELTCTDQPADQTVGVRSLGPDGVKGTEDDLTSWTMGREVTELARGKRWTPAPVAVVPDPKPAVATIKKPDGKKPQGKKPDGKKPDPKAGKPTGIVDLDGDGIPDSR